MSPESNVDNGSLAREGSEGNNDATWVTHMIICIKNLWF